ncbi:hypothetical protein [Alcaligenes sp. Marseille-Q7550]
MIHPIDNTQGDLKLLAMAIQALIETHPDKKAFHAAFKEIFDNSGLHSLYAGEKAQPHTGQLLQDIFRTAHSQAKLPQDLKATDQSS